MEITRQAIAPIIGLDYKDESADGLAWLADHGNPYQVSLIDTDGRVGIELGVGFPKLLLSMQKASYATSTSVRSMLTSRAKS